MKKFTTVDWWILLGSVVLITSLFVGDQKYDINALFYSGEAGDFIFWYIIALIIFAFTGFRLLRIQNLKK